MGLNGICVAWTTSCSNQTASILALKFGWTSSEKIHTFINVSSLLGKAVGAIFGGIVIQFGRKKVFVCFNILAILSLLLMQIVSGWMLILGQFLYGVFVTVVHMACLKMINETIPVYLLGSFGTVVQTGASFGHLLLLGLGIP